jgi:integrase
MADGTIKVFWYYGRGKGAIRLEGEPGSSQFLTSYNLATSQKVTPQAGVLQSILTNYQGSAAFANLRDRTRKDYAQHLRRIEAEFGDLPINDLTDRRVRQVFLRWRDERARTSKRQADYAWSVLKTVFNWAKEQGLVNHNPCEGGRRLYQGSRVNVIWSLEDEVKFCESADRRMRLALLLGLWTAQREGDLIRLAWSSYDGRTIKLTQHKTHAPVIIPVARPLKAALDSAPKLSPLILTNEQGRPWTAHSFQRAWAKACRQAGVTAKFTDLRGTAITRLAIAGCNHIEIASISGHSVADVGRILKKHYLHQDPAIAANAIRKLEENIRRTNLQTEVQTEAKK